MGGVRVCSGLGGFVGWHLLWTDHINTALGQSRRPSLSRAWVSGDSQQFYFGAGEPVLHTPCCRQHRLPGLSPEFIHSLLFRFPTHCSSACEPQTQRRESGLLFAFLLASVFPVPVSLLFCLAPPGHMEGTHQDSVCHDPRPSAAAAAWLPQVAPPRAPGPVETLKASAFQAQRTVQPLDQLHPGLLSALGFSVPGLSWWSPLCLPPSVPDHCCCHCLPAWWQPSPSSSFDEPQFLSPQRL